MAMQKAGDHPDGYAERLAALQETETQMGERAALLADIADALSHFPGAVEVGADHITFADRRIDADEWMNLSNIATMVHTWREQRAGVDAMWRAMSVEERAGMNAPPEMGGIDATRAWV